MKRSPKFKVLLRNSDNQEMELEYVLGPSPSAEIWFAALTRANSESVIESSQFYNFKTQPDGQLNQLTAKLEHLLGLLKREIPVATLDKTSDDSLQKCLNHLHVNFAHNHLIEKSITPGNQELWSEFNTIIHKVESALIAKNAKAPIDLCRIEFSWRNGFKTPIPASCFGEFSLRKSFASIQISYCQVGRHLTELFAARDTEVPAEHIQPARFFSANSTLWFGPDYGEAYEQNHSQNIKSWFLKSEEKFNSAGVFWNSEEKALGSVTVAKLLREFHNSEEKKLFQLELSDFSEVAGIILEE